MAVAYFASMISLAWIYTPSERRILGPAFWMRRAAAIPLAAFLAYCGFFHWYWAQSFAEITNAPPQRLPWFRQATPRQTIHVRGSGAPVRALEEQDNIT
jgi:hypothetical protein